METQVSEQEKQMQSHKNKGRKSPTMKTPKILQSVNEEIEKAEVDTYLKEVRDFLGQTPDKNSASLSRATWIPDLQCVKVLKKVGKKWNCFGHRIMGNDVLYPEEAVYLLEIHNLEILHGEVPMSLEKAYTILLSGNYGCSLDEYRVYAQLVTLGYRVFRHDPELIVNQNPKQIAKEDPKLKANQDPTSDTVEPDKVQNQPDKSKTNSCMVQVTSKCTRFATKFTVDCLEDKASLKVFQNLMYAKKHSNEKSPENAEPVPVHDLDSSSSEESDEDDSESDIVIVNSRIVKEKPSSGADIMLIESEKPPAQRNTGIEILTLDSSDEETSVPRNSSTHKSGTKNTFNIVEDDVLVIEDAGVNSRFKKEHNEDVVIEDFIPFCSNTKKNINMKTERKDEIVHEDFIPFNTPSNSNRRNVKTEKRNKGEELSMIERNKRQRKIPNKNNKLLLSKNIFENSTEDSVFYSDNETMGSDAASSTIDSNMSHLSSNATNSIMDLNTFLSDSNTTNSAVDSVAQFVQGAMNQLSQGLGGSNQRGGVMSYPRGGWGNPSCQNTFSPRNQFQPHYTRNFYNENNQGPVSNCYPPVNPGYVANNSLLPSPCPNLDVQSPLNPAFNQLSQLNQLLEGINVNIQKSVGGLYRLKRLQDPNYRPTFRRPRPRHFGDRNNAFGNYGPRYNQFNDARGQFNPRNQFPTPTNQFPQYNGDFNGPHSRFPHPNQQPFINNQTNMVTENSFQPIPEQQQQLYGSNDYNTQRIMNNRIDNNGNNDHSNETVNNQKSQRPNVKQEILRYDSSSNDEEESSDDDSDEDMKPNIVNNQMSHGPNVKQEVCRDDTSSSDEEESSDEEVKPGIETNVDNTKNKSQAIASSSTSINIKKENQTSGKVTNTHIRFNLDSSSDEENAEITKAGGKTPGHNESAERSGQMETTNIHSKKSTSDKNGKIDGPSSAKRIKIDDKKESTSEEESSDDDSDTNRNGLVKKIEQENKKESNDDESSEEDSGQDSSDADTETIELSNFDVGFKKRTHIRFNIEDSDDEIDEKKNEKEKTNDKQMNVQEKPSGIQKISGSTTDDELEQENEKLIIFHSEIITPEQQNHFLTSFSSDPLDILDHILTTRLTHERIKLINKKIRKSFPRQNTSRQLLRRVLKHEQKVLKKRRYNVRKRLLRRAMQREGCKTYIGTVLTSQSEATRENNDETVPEIIKNDDKKEAKIINEVLGVQVFENKECEKVEGRIIVGELDDVSDRAQSERSETQEEVETLDREVNKKQQEYGVSEPRKNLNTSGIGEKSAMNENDVILGELDKTEKMKEVLHKDNESKECEIALSNKINEEKEQLKTSNEVIRTHNAEKVPNKAQNVTIETSVEMIPSPVETTDGDKNSEIKEDESSDTETLENIRIHSSNSSEHIEESLAIMCESNLQTPQEIPEKSTNLNASTDPTMTNESIHSPCSEQISKKAGLAKACENETDSGNSDISKEVESEQNKSDITVTKVVDAEIEMDESSKNDSETSKLIDNTEVSVSAINSNILVDTMTNVESNIVSVSTIEEHSFSDKTKTSVDDVQNSIQNETVTEAQKRDIETTKSHQDKSDNKGTEMNIDETTEEDACKKGGSSNETQAAENTHKILETESLMKDKEVTSYSSLYKKLDIFNKNPPPDGTGDIVPLTIMFDVYCATGKNFAKTKRGAPDYRVIIVQPDHELPSPGQMSELQARYPDANTVPYIFAVALPGSINYYRYADVFIPTLLEDLDQNNETRLKMSCNIFF